MPDTRSRPRVVLADDHLLLAKSLERFLEESFEVVGTVGDGKALLEVAAAERPDVIVCDISMPELDGLEATRRLVSEDPEVRVVMLSMHADVAHVKGAFRAGASGYLTKSAAPDELVTALREVLQGRCYLSPAATKGLVRSLVTPPEGPGRASADPESPPLSPREREVLQQVAKGRSNQQIADCLCISEATVRSHLSRLYDKLDLSNRVELALHAVQSPHLVEPTRPTPSGARP